MTLRLRELDYGAVPWDVLNSCKDRTLLQTKAWLEYLAETQHATPVVAAVEQGTQVLGYVRGLVIRRFGLRILGSPFPGWTTSHMAFNVEGDVAEVDLLDALARTRSAQRWPKSIGRRYDRWKREVWPERQVYRHGDLCWNEPTGRVLGQRKFPC